MIYACTITFSTHKESLPGDTEGKFVVLCEAEDVRDVIEKVLPAKLKLAAETSADYIEFYLVSMVELVVPLRGAMILGFLEHPLRETAQADADAWSDFLLEEDEERARACKHASVSEETPVFTHGRLPERLAKSKE